MHPINKLLSFFGFRIARTRASQPGIPGAFLDAYRRQLETARKTGHRFDVIEECYFDAGEHPEDNAHFEFAFAAMHLCQLKPSRILDIGSGRHFVLGLLAHFEVTTIDVRPRTPMLPNETVITCDAKKLTLPDAGFDVVTSLSSVEHFGLGRYGDEFDLEADCKAVAEMIRVLRPTGHLILTLPFTRGRPTLAFNAHRIYDLDLVHSLCTELSPVEEKFYSHRVNGFCPLKQISAEPGVWDVYCGCWRKNESGTAR